MNNSKGKFLVFATKLCKHALQRTDSIIKDILKKQVDFTADEKIIITKEANEE